MNNENKSSKAEKILSESLRSLRSYQLLDSKSILFFFASASHSKSRQMKDLFQLASPADVLQEEEDDLVCQFQRLSWLPEAMLRNASYKPLVQDWNGRLSTACLILKCMSRSKWLFKKTEIG